MINVRKLRNKVAATISVGALVLGSLIATSTAANAAAPGNDLFANPTVIPAAGGTISAQTNIDATIETNEYVGTGSGANAWGQSIWYSWEPTTTGSTTIDVCSATYKTAIAVYEYSTADTPVLPTAVPGANGGVADATGCATTTGAKLTFTVATGFKYRIQISSKGGVGVASGTFNISITAPGAVVTKTLVELDRVTICHRTHSTTNPYRMITVSASSIVGAAPGSPVRGHGLHATDARRYNPELYGTFDSTKSYRPSAKLWGDIIPPFKDAATGGEFPGLNWSWGDPADGDTNTVLDRTEFGAVTINSANAVAQVAVDACKGASGQLTPRQFFDLERRNGEKRKDILDELGDTDQYEPDVYKEKNEIEKDLPEREGPKNIPTAIAQSLAGVVWLDINRNGFQENNEPLMSNIRVTVQNGTSAFASGGTFTGFGTGARVFADLFGANVLTNAIDAGFNSLSPVINSIRSLLGMATTYTVYTDGNGSYLFKSLESGEWFVSGVVPAGLDVTYDSSGVSDATVDTTVPAGGHAFTWIGLMGDSSTGINALVRNPDGTLANKDVVITSSGTDGIFCNEDDVNFILTPVNGRISLSGISNSSYYIAQIGSTSTIADFDVVLGQIYTNDIRTVAGVRCAALKKQLAATGGDVDGRSALVLGLLIFGTVATFIGQSGRRKYSN